MSVSQKQKHHSRRVGAQTKKQRRQLKQKTDRQQKQLAEMQLAAKSRRLTGRRRRLKRAMVWSGLLSILVLFVLGLIYFTKGPKPETATPLADATPPEATHRSADATPAETPPQPTQPTPALGWTLGNPNASTILVEFSDYQCPRCADYYPILKRLTEEFGNDLLLVYRHYPLRQHKNAGLAAISAEAAGRQGKFWEMHDLLLAGQKAWSEKEQEAAEGIFLQYAASLNLDVSQFQSDLRSQEILNKITTDYQIGHRSGVTGTPSFFLNGQKVTEPPRTYEAFKALILQSKQDVP